jgi:hypothetical protein
MGITIHVQYLMAPRSRTPLLNWHCGVKLHSIIDTVRSNSTSKLILWSQTPQHCLHYGIKLPNIIETTGTNSTASMIPRELTHNIINTAEWNSLPQLKTAESKFTFIKSSSLIPQGHTPLHDLHLRIKLHSIIDFWHHRANRRVWLYNIINTAVI